MDDVVIRPITGDDDMDAQLDLGQRAFGVSSAGQRAGWSYLAGLRAGQGLFLGAFAGGVPAGAAMIHDMRQWWLGRAVPCAGIGSVKVAPEYRGGGIGRRLMTALLNAVAERGYPLSALYPATMPIYRSLGWELAGGRYVATVPARSLRTLVGPDSAAIPAGARTAGARERGGTRHPPGRARQRRRGHRRHRPRPSGRPRRRAADLGRRPDQAVAGRTGPVLVPGRRRWLRVLRVGR